MYDCFPHAVQVKCFPVATKMNDGKVFRSNGSLLNYNYGDELPMCGEDYHYPKDTLIVDFNYLGELDDTFENELFSIFVVKDNLLAAGYFSMEDIEGETFDFSNPIVDTYGHLWKVNSLDELKELRELVSEEYLRKAKYIRERRKMYEINIVELEDFLSDVQKRLEKYKV